MMQSTCNRHIGYVCFYFGEKWFFMVSCILLLCCSCVCDNFVVVIFFMNCCFNYACGYFLFLFKCFYLKLHRFINPQIVFMTTTYVNVCLNVALFRFSITFLEVSLECMVWLWKWSELWFLFWFRVQCTKYRVFFCSVID